VFDHVIAALAHSSGYNAARTARTRRPQELVDVTPGTYRRHAARATAGMPSCVAKQVTRPIRNREAPVTDPHLA
jgi:hypothetical protein